MPDLILIDGGKGQLAAALDALEEQGVSVPVVGLAKREEEIVVHKVRSNVTVDISAVQAWAREKSPFDEATVRIEPGKELEGKYVSLRIREDVIPGVSDDSEDFLVINLPKNNHIIKLLQRIRDESHRFAVSYHTHLKRTGQVKSVLDDIPGVGPVTRKRLLKAFGSVAGIRDAQTAAIAKEIGLVKAKTVKAHLR